jgi:hypothetical protein
MVDIDISTAHFDFYNDLANAAEAQGDYKENAFFEIFCDEILEVGEIPSFDRAHYESTGIRVDGFSWNDLEESANLTLIVVDFNQSTELKTITQGDMDAAFRRLSKFIVSSRTRKFLDAQEVTSPHFGLASLISEEWDRISKIRMILITNRILSSRIDGLSDEAIDSKPASRSVWDFGRFFAVRSSAIGRENIEIDLENDFGGAIKILSAANSDSPYEAFLAVIPGIQLAEIYGRYTDRLLEQNVRVFLQAKGGVNKGIRRTLHDDPAMFFAYNNGITATAEEIITKMTPHGLVATSFKNLQIVNGGQTTASIYEASQHRDSDLSKVFVQMKISVIDTDRIDEIVPRISEFANTQNKVTSADFFSNHPFHVRFEECSRRIWASPKSGGARGSKWFYERARGQYGVSRSQGTNMATKQFDLEYPKDQVLNKTDLAKYLMSWRGLPHVVSQGAQKNFKSFAEQIEKEWETNSNNFNDLLFQDAIGKTILFRATERIVSKSDWYQGGYRANIVAYAISKFAFDLKGRGKELNFDLIWREQKIRENVEGALYISAEVAQATILNPGTSHRNIGEWAKQDKCWQALKLEKVEWPSEIDSATLDFVEVNERKRAGVFLREMDNGIISQTKVVSAGAQFWTNVSTWGEDRGLITLKERDIIQICKQIPKKIPTDKQCSVAYQAVKRLVAEGFRDGESFLEN